MPKADYNFFSHSFNLQFPKQAAKRPKMPTWTLRNLIFLIEVLQRNCLVNHCHCPQDIPGLAPVWMFMRGDLLSLKAERLEDPKKGGGHDFPLRDWEAEWSRNQSGSLKSRLPARGRGRAGAAPQHAEFQSFLVAVPMRQVPLECDINIAVNGCSGFATSTQKGPFMAMLISCSRGTCFIHCSLTRKLRWPRLWKFNKTCSIWRPMMTWSAPYRCCVPGNCYC